MKAESTGGKSFRKIILISLTSMISDLYDLNSLKIHLDSLIIHLSHLTFIYLRFTKVT